MWSGLNRLSVVAVAMKDELEVCVHCRHNFLFCVSDDIGFRFHWFGDYYLVDVVLFVEGSCFFPVLFREVYAVESGV